MTISTEAAFRAAAEDVLGAVILLYSIRSLQALLSKIGVGVARACIVVGACTVGACHITTYAIAQAKRVNYPERWNCLSICDAPELNIGIYGKYVWSNDLIVVA